MLVVKAVPSEPSTAYRGLHEHDLRTQALFTALKALLRATRAIKSSYQKAIWRTNATRYAPLRALFDRHHAEQRELGNMLAGRICLVAGLPTEFSNHYSLETQFCAALLRRAAPIGLLQGLKEHHGCVLRAASPSTRLFGDATDWARDFAVGHVVLTNDLQRAAVVEQLEHWDRRYRFMLDHNSGEM